MIEMCGNYIGCLHSEMECSKIISLAMENIMFRLKRRLNEKEKRLIRPGYAFIYLEQESGIMRWTDSKLWTPSRALGPFMMYIEKRSDTPLIKKIYSAQYDGLNVHLVIYNLLNHEENGICCNIYHSIKKGLLPDHFGIMSRCFLRRRKKDNIKRKNISADKNFNYEYDFFNQEKNYDLIDFHGKSVFLESNSIVKNNNLKLKSHLSNDNIYMSKNNTIKSINNNHGCSDNNMYNFEIETDIERKKIDYDNKNNSSRLSNELNYYKNSEFNCNFLISEKISNKFKSCLSLNKNENTLMSISNLDGNKNFFFKDANQNLQNEICKDNDNLKKKESCLSKLSLINQGENLSDNVSDEN